MGIGYPGSRHHIFQACILDTESDIVENRVVEEDGLLVDISYQPSETLQTGFPDVDAVYRDRTGNRIVESRYEIHHCGFSGSGCTHDGNRLAFRNVQADIVENHSLPVRIPERDIPE